MDVKALIVSDSSALRSYIASAIERTSTVEIVSTQLSNGFDALRELARERFDLVIIETNLPDIQGTEIARSMRRVGENKSVPLIVVGTVNDRSFPRAIELGATACLQKPFTPEQIKDLIAPHLPQLGI